MGGPHAPSKAGQNLFREILIHSVVLFSILVSCILVRKLFGEARVSGLEIDYILKTSTSNALLGPVISLSTFIYRPIETLFFPPVENHATLQYINMPILPAILIYISILSVWALATIQMFNRGQKEEALSIF